MGSLVEAKSVETTVMPVSSSRSLLPSVRGAELSVVPSAALEQIADLAGVSMGKLTTLELGPRTRDAYHAALEYAALHDHVPLTNSLTRNKCEREKSPSSASASTEAPAYFAHNVPCSLWISPTAQSHGSSTDSDDDDDDHGHSEDDDDEDEEGSVLNTVDPDLFPHHQLKKEAKHPPKYHMGLGTKTVRWPPPPHLTANALVRQYHDRLTKKNHGSGDVKDVETENSEETHVTEVPTDSSASPSPETMEAESMLVYFIHYVSGPPVAMNACANPGPDMYRVLLLVGVNGQVPLQRFVTEVLEWRLRKDHRSRPGRYALYRYKTSGPDGWWDSQGLKRARLPSSVVLPKGQLDSIMEDVGSFLERGTKSWYIRHGLPHRRCYLFYGPPGVGKTSTIRAIASKFKLSCCFLTVTNSLFNNQNLCDALSELPSSPLLVIEDVDALFNEDRKTEDGGHLTFSGMLNALDGLTSADGVVTVMTTNHIERLDTALIRGGRVDRRFEFCRPTQSQLVDLFLTFYPQAGNALAHRFASEVMSRSEGDEARSIATLQQHFIGQRRASAEECVEALSSFYETHFPSGFTGRSSTLYA